MPQEPWLLAEHQRRNLTTLNANALFAAHRQRVMRLLKQAAGDLPERLCVLGAGNCNDLDLGDLLAEYLEIVLVDLDRAASVSAVATAIDDSLRHRIHIADSTDVTGAFECLQVADTKDFGSDAAADLLRLFSAVPQIPFAPFDCIVSTCLLSQLIDSLVLALGQDHPSIVPLILALRKQHLRTLVQSLVQGGRGLLIFDFVSSQSSPNLMQIDEGHLNHTLIDAINAKNFFTGLNPFVVQAEMATHADLSGLIRNIRLHPPWRWDIGQKQFAVSAISFVRSHTR